MTWIEVLDDLERGADACDRYFVRGEGEPPSALLAPPDHLGPLPEDLSSRARAVLRRIDALNAAMQRLPKPAAEAGRTHFAGAASPRPVRFDQVL